MNVAPIYSFVIGKNDCYLIAIKCFTKVIKRFQWKHDKVHFNQYVLMLLFYMYN